MTLQVVIMNSQPTVVAQPLRARVHSVHVYGMGKLWDRAWWHQQGGMEVEGRGGAGGWGQGAGNDRAAAENNTQHEPTCNYCIIVHQHHHHYN